MRTRISGWKIGLAATGALTVLTSFACGGGSGEDPQVKRGRVVFETNCIACHARNPAEAGPIGPAVAGSSLELLEAKVVRNEYPTGYTPKRESQAMVPLAHLEAELPAVHAYLAKAAEGS